MGTRVRGFTFSIAGVATVAAVLAVALPSMASPSSAQHSTVSRIFPAPIVGLVAGVASWGNKSMAGRMDTVIARTGAKWLREGFLWSRVEPRPGRFTFSHYDHFMVLAARRHEHVMLVLYSAPRWAGATPNTVPSNPAAYAAYVAAVVGRYGPHGSLWIAHPALRQYAVKTYELWDEAYDPIGDNNRYDPARYAKLVKAATTAGRAADPAAKFLLGAEMQGELVGSSWVWWVDALYRAVPDLNNYFDGVAVHPYGHDITGLAPAIPDHQYFGYRQMRRIEIIRRQLVKHGAAAKPFWASEVGWPTCSSGSERCVSPAGQANSLRTIVRYMQTTWRRYVHAVFVYYYNDVGGSPSNPETDYGLTYANEHPKPALQIFRAFAQRSPATSWPFAPAP